MKSHRSLRFVTSAVVLAGILAACGGGSQSSDDSVARTRNSTLDLTQPATVAMYTGIDATGIPKFYTASLATGGTVTGTELFSDTAGFTTNVTGLAFDSATRTVYWITQEGSTAKVRSRQLDSGTTNTLYSYASTIPYGLGYDSVKNVLYWTGVMSGSPKMWSGDPSGSTATEVVTGNFRALSVSENRLYAIDATKVNSYSLPTFSRTPIAGGIGTDSWAVIADETNSKVYYTTGYTTSSQIKQANLNGSGTPVDHVTPIFPAGQLAMKSNGALVWTNGAVPGVSTPSRDTGIYVVDPDDTLTSLGFLPSPALKTTVLWLIEVPQTDVDPEVTGDGLIGSTYTCNDASWASDLTAQKLSRAPEPDRTYAWYANGSLVAGEIGSTYVATGAGTVKCSVEASNLAGSTVVESAEFTVAAPTTTSAATASTSPTSAGATPGSTASSSPSTTAVPSATSASVTYPSIKVKWSYAASTKTLKGTFTKVSGASSYSMVLAGATKKTVKCKLVKTKVTCSYKLKKGSNSIVVNAKSAAKVIVAQRVASKQVK